MNFTEYALKNKALVYFFVFVLVVGGIYSFFTMSKLEDPGHYGETSYGRKLLSPGASAWQVELEVTDVLEKSIRSMGDLDHVESRSMGRYLTYSGRIEQYGTISRITAELGYPAPLKWRTYTAQLPAGAQPSMVMDDFGDVYGMFYA